MDHHPNVSSRLRAVREFTELSCRALDRVAGRPEGTTAIIEGRAAEGIRRHVAQSYCDALGVEVAWLMLGVGPAIAGHPELDPERPEDREAIAELIGAAVRQAREAQARQVASAHTANDFTVDRDPAYDQSAGG